MNAYSLLLARRGAPVCLSCRRSILRQFSSSPPASFASSFQSYPLNPHPPPQPRNAAVPDSSIAQPVAAPLPKVHDTRPPKDPPRVAAEVEQAQNSSPSSAAPESSSSTPDSSSSKTTSQAPMPPRASAAQTHGATTSPPAPKPRSKLRTPRKAAMRLTPAAISRLQAMLDAPEPKLIKVGVRNRGCSGLAYHLEYVERPGAFDETIEQDGVRVLIDSKALFSIIGSEMDWVEDKLSQRFVFRNPNIKEQCGCGESFMV